MVTGLALLKTEARSLFDATNDRGALHGLFSPNTYDFAPGIWAATATSGRDLPDCINFDPATLLLSVDAAAVPQGAGPVTVRISHLPDQPGLKQGWLSTVTGQFGIEVVIDPATGVLPSVNALLATQAFFAAQGLFAAPINGSANVNLANGNLLPARLTFDAATKTFTGTLPDGDYVGALQVRFAIPATSDRPAFDVIAEVVVDPVLDTRTGLGFTWQVVNNRVVFAIPEDFDGSFVFT